jgi:hypothetical protein
MDNTLKSKPCRHCGAMPNGVMHICPGRSFGEPCPTCSRIAEKLDREKLAKVMVEKRACVGPLVTLSHYADAIIKYLKEGGC